jgi:hypothetical protein
MTSMFEQDPLSCDGTGSYDTTKCISCKECSDMHALVGTPCTGASTYDSQSCQKCTATCPVGMYIKWDVERCNGKHWATVFSPSDRPFDPASECVPCGGCPGWVLHQLCSVCVCMCVCVYVFVCVCACVCVCVVLTPIPTMGQVLPGSSRRMHWYHEGRLCCLQRMY